MSCKDVHVVQEELYSVFLVEVCISNIKFCHSSCTCLTILVMTLVILATVLAKLSFFCVFTFILGKFFPKVMIGKVDLIGLYNVKICLTQKNSRPAKVKIFVSIWPK